MATEHTPGPWEIIDLRHQRNGQIKTESEAPGQHHIIANVMRLGENAEADANLIVAAPDLLRSLETALPELVQLVKDIGGCDHSVGICCCGLNAMIADAQDAIAKAKGQRRASTHPGW